MRWLLAAWALVAAPGCYDVKTVDPGIEVLPDEAGRVDVGELGIRGQWFSYGDNYDYPQSCTAFGHHPAAACSLVVSPVPLPRLNFPSPDGELCTAGSVGEAVPCSSGVLNCRDGSIDFSNMWGAGIGLDFDLDVTSGERHPLDRKAWDARAHHVAGISFDLRWFDDGSVSGPHLRVEFPMVLPDNLKVQPGKASFGLKDGDEPVAPGVDNQPAPYPDPPPIPSEEHPEGSPYWGAGSTFGNARVDVSPVHVGHNQIRFTDTIQAPESDYVFDATRLLGIQFHVSSFTADAPASDGSGQHFGYGFCISNLTFLRE